MASESREGGASTSGRSLYRKLAFAHEEGDREWHRLLNAVIRGAGAGFCLRGGIHLISWLFAALVKSRPGKLHQARLQTALDQLLDTARYTLFLGSLSGVYVGVDEGIANYFGRERTARWRGFLAGLLAGPTILFTGVKSKHNSLALYVLLRGLTLLVRCGNKPDSPPLVRRVLAPTRWEHGDTAMMCLATSQLGYSWIIYPRTLPPAYVHFLNHHGGKRLHHYEATRELADANKLRLPPKRLTALRGTKHASFCKRTPCGFLHPGRGCSANLFAFMPQAYLRALPVYAPVYILPAILVHRQKLLKIEGETLNSRRQGGAAKIWAKVGLGTLRSSLFLASYCALAWGGACVGFKATGTCTPSVIFLYCWTGGLATLVEKKSRRMELALYCASRAIESWALCLVEWGWVRRGAVPRLDVAMFCLACASILHCYSDDCGRHRDVFRSKYLNVLDFIFGNRGLEKGTIQHVPSTHDLLAAQGIDASVLRRRASAFAASIATASDEAAAGSPRSDASEAVFARLQRDSLESEVSEEAAAAAATLQADI